MTTPDPLALAREIKGRHQESLIRPGFCECSHIVGFPGSSRLVDAPCDAYRAAEELERVVGDWTARLRRCEEASADVLTRYHTEYQRAEALAGEVENLRAAAWLAGEDIGFWCQGGKSFALLCSDTFGYACADCEEIRLEDAPKAAEVFRNEGWPGIVRWIATVRGSRPLKEVEASMKTIDAMRMRAEAAEASLEASLLRERGLREALAALVDAEWMVSCDWTSRDKREVVVELARKSLTPPAPTAGEGK